jgi:hypothetical protein
VTGVDPTVEREDLPEWKGTNDVIGCGLMPDSIFFTGNGKLIGKSTFTNYLIIENCQFAGVYPMNSKGVMYPTVKISQHAEVEANFGPEFQYNLNEISSQMDNLD